MRINAHNAHHAACISAGHVRAGRYTAAHIARVAVVSKVLKCTIYSRGENNTKRPRWRTSAQHSTVGVIPLRPIRQKITLETNCIIGLFDSGSASATSLPELQSLFRCALSGNIEVSITTRVEVDLSRDKDSSRAEMLRYVSMMPVVDTVMGWGASQWDCGDFIADDETIAMSMTVQRIVFPSLNPNDQRYANCISDVDHLVGHYLRARDIFVTDDKDILRRRSELQEGLGIVVMNPAECLAHIAASS